MVGLASEPRPCCLQGLNFSHVLEVGRGCCTTAFWAAPGWGLCPTNVALQRPFQVPGSQEVSHAHHISLTPHRAPEPPSWGICYPHYFKHSSHAAAAPRRPLPSENLHQRRSTI